MLETKRLRIRLFREDDLDEIVLEKLGFVYLRDDHYYDADVRYHRMEESRWMSRTANES